MLCLLSAHAQGVVSPFYLWPLHHPSSLPCVMASPLNEAKMYSLLVFSSQTLCSQLSFTSQDRPVPIQKVTEKVSPEVPDGGAVSALMGLDGFLVCDSKERYSMSLAVKFQIRFAFINLVALRHLV